MKVNTSSTVNLIKRELSSKDQEYHLARLSLLGLRDNNKRNALNTVNLINMKKGKKGHASILRLTCPSLNFGGLIVKQRGGKNE